MKTKILLNVSSGALLLAAVGCGGSVRLANTAPRSEPVHAQPAQPVRETPPAAATDSSGLADNPPPGHGGTPPGHGGTPPGHADSPPGQSRAEEVHERNEERKAAHDEEKAKEQKSDDTDDKGKGKGKAKGKDKKK
jgi:hypothetical protein